MVGRALELTSRQRFCSAPFPQGGYLDLERRPTEPREHGYAPGAVMFRSMQSAMLFELRRRSGSSSVIGSAFPFEELLVLRDFALVGAPHLQPGRDHFVVTPLDLGS
jgi:hypothetical protein